MIGVKSSTNSRHRSVPRRAHVLPFFLIEVMTVPPFNTLEPPTPTSGYSVQVR